MIKYSRSYRNVVKLGVCPHLSIMLGVVGGACLVTVKPTTPAREIDNRDHEKWSEIEP